MSSRPRATLGRILDDLGATFTDQVITRGLDRKVSSVVIHDPLDDAPVREDAILLGVGVTGEDVRPLLGLAGAAGATAIVVRSPVEVAPELEAAVRESGVALLTLRRGASWSQLAALLGSLLSQDDFGRVDSETLGGLPSGDLFSVANAIGSLLGAPITIEDRSSKVLAFSGAQDEADPSRIETILGRQVPERFAALLAERGVFAQLYRSAEPVFIEPGQPDDAFFQPRVAMAVRAGDEVLGSIWAAVSGPLDEARTRAMVDASSIVALHLLRLRAGADVERRLRADLVSTALEGGPNAAEALDRLGLQASTVCVVAVRLVEGATPGSESLREAEHRADSTRLADTLAVHLVSSSPRSAAALVGKVIYGLVPSDNPGRVESIAHDFALRIADKHVTVIGVSDPAHGVDALPRARSQADRASRALLRRSSDRPQVAQIGSVSVDTVLMDLADLADARDDVSRGPIAILHEHDEDNQSHLVDTLAAWLDAFGDVALAAKRVHVHPNTFRYRLRRLAEIADLDLGDADARFAAMLEIRMRSARR
ncbi:PucR family transcriptional regulator [Ornithinimicrobium pratense]|uniref:PucR family transcriptional regulator n=1 Tax=Ornithinimicrobium pratense TaxID=2593973 RepID=A0A5J6V5J2_9MICO|nr:helix-turn-helix domain-containing protein [Ornithinimicrobium pratense]QFG68456.1 PucR family transcriptional regulator [Ornithinimicrobium pratense]